MSLRYEHHATTSESETQRETPRPTGPVRVLVVDDDPIVAESLAEFVRTEGDTAMTANSGAEAIALLASGAGESGRRSPGGFQVMLCDVGLPDMNGMRVLERVAELHPEIAAVLLTGYGSIEAAVSSLRAGAVDFLTKPLIDQELRLALERARRQHVLKAENTRLKTQLGWRFIAEDIVGEDERMQSVFELVRAVAPSRTTVLMCGESGTGKSMLARAIHQHSARADGPYVELSCGSIPESLLESELFGHVKGAFTGAHTDKPGRFLAADGGTLFLDEINSASPAMQLKLLRVLQERKFEAVGTSQTQEVDVRVVLASNEALEVLVADGRFRQDLYYRINVMKIELPPLRDRVGDIPRLAQRFLASQAEELGRTIEAFDADAMDALRRYPFPGNVRELSNIVERAAVLCRGDRVTLADLPEQVTGEASGPLVQRLVGASDGQLREEAGSGEWEPMPLSKAIEREESRVLRLALEAHGWNRVKTAESLGINRTTLYKKMKAYEIEEDEGRAA